MDLEDYFTTQRPPRSFNTVGSRCSFLIPGKHSHPTIIGIIGVGYLFTFFEIFNINVSFIQTCLQIIPGCTLATANHYLGTPVLLNLAGYVVGTLVFSPLADCYGRKGLLVIALVITGLGSLYTANAGDYTNFIIGRTLTGIGVGADLSIVNTISTRWLHEPRAPSMPR